MKTFWLCVLVFTVLLVTLCLKEPGEISCDAGVLSNKKRIIREGRFAGQLVVGRSVTQSKNDAVERSLEQLVEQMANFERVLMEFISQISGTVERLGLSDTHADSRP
ncbi:unnamed protein product [Calicophoron daubneyi]|uniref:Uncharacterized protein n=1 Tax=Calicophoron daubneyi TaxID=300641 RepID=A0AAV2SYY6_CALDB